MTQSVDAEAYDQALRSRSLFRVHHEASDTKSRHLQLLAVNESQPGTLLVEVPPACQGTKGFAVAILRALGRPHEVPRTAGEALEFVASWLLAAETTELIFTRAHLLTPSLLDLVGALGGWLDLPVRLLFQQKPHRNLRRRARHWCEIDSPEKPYVVKEFPTEAPKAAPSQSPENPLAQLTVQQLPASDFKSFRADCRRSLNLALFAAVDDLYWRASQDVAIRCFECALDGDGFAEVLKDRFRALGSGERLVILRAAEAAVFVSGGRLKVEPNRLIYALGEETPDETAIEAAGRAIASEADPVKASLVAVLLSVRCELRDLKEMTAPAAFPQAGKRPLVRPELGQPTGAPGLLAMRALRLQRAYRSTSPDVAALWLTPAGSAMTSSAMARALKEVAVRTAIPVEWAVRPRPSRHNWMYRRGLQFEASM